MLCMTAPPKGEPRAGIQNHPGKGERICNWYMAAIGPGIGPSSGGTRWIFRPTSARWACRKGWPGPSRRHCPRRTATPTPCAGSCGQSWRSMRACRRSRSSAAMGRQTLSSGWSGPKSPAGRWSPHPPLRSMPLLWKVSAARWNDPFCGSRRTLRSRMRSVRPSARGWTWCSSASPTTPPAS